MIGSAVAGERLGFLRDDIDFFGLVPKLLADLIPTRASNPSQIRAREVAEATNDASVAAIQSIGRAAMAARNPPVRNLQLMVDVLSLGRAWPSPRFHATTTDCYTGERIVLSQSSNVPISHAVCASVSLPGVFGPTWIGDRLCMDGAMCSTSTHVDLVVGAKRALVVALTDKSMRFSGIPNDIAQELNYVEAAGTRTLPDRCRPRQGPPLVCGRDRTGAARGQRSRRPRGRSGEGILGLSVALFLRFMLRHMVQINPTRAARNAGGRLGYSMQWLM
jgi:NTE family protein